MCHLLVTARYDRVSGVQLENLFKIILYSFFAGVTVFLGGLLSKCFERHFQDGLIKKEIIHTSIAFGGGIIVVAVFQWWHTLLNISRYCTNV